MKRLLTSLMGALLVSARSEPAAVKMDIPAPVPKVHKKDSFANQRLRDKQRKMERKARRRGY